MDPRMKVCTKCGWYLTNLPSNHKCRPDLAVDANKLATLVPAGLDVPSTKLGYGDHNVTFMVDGNVSVTFNCEGKGRFSLEHIFYNKPIDLNVAAKMIEDLAACVKMDVEKLPCVCGGAYVEHFFLTGPRACQHCATCEKYEEDL